MAASQFRTDRNKPREAGPRFGAQLRRRPQLGRVVTRLREGRWLAKPHNRDSDTNLLERNPAVSRIPLIRPLHLRYAFGRAIDLHGL
jgi:hypothetical protein